MFKGVFCPDEPTVINPFSTIVRIRLILDIIKNPHPHKHDHDESYCAEHDSIDLDKLMVNGDKDKNIPNSVIAYYPLHDNKERSELANEWIYTNFFDPWKKMNKAEPLSIK